MDITTKTLKDFSILPPRPGLCAICAYDHEDYIPHRVGSIYYQFRFHKLHDRLPTWCDAVAHLPKDIQQKIKQMVVEMSDEWEDCKNPIAEPYKIQE